jgi:GNAT superfamily N-acetyltransferase
MDDIQIKTYSSFDDSVLKAVVGLEQLLFEQPMAEQAILDEAKNKFDLVILIAWAGTAACGYKVGFQHSAKRFYSWIGGVHPNYRAKGIAKRLMRGQHSIAKKLGYKYVFTYTKNRYRPMLVLNIKTGFDIIGVRHNLGSDGQSIILEKALD